jgi:aminopeptidase
VQAWKDHAATLKRRCEAMNDSGIRSLRITGPGTDLNIELCSESIWIGGPCTTPDGRVFIPNMPTEEIFTTPDYRKTSGKVSVTRPVKVMETLVDGAWFEFKDGRVIQFGADSGREVLEKYLSVDEGASFVGEIALVDSSSPIYQSGCIFSSILYDENASCHLALGNGYPTGLKNGSTLRGKQQLLDAGCNVSLVHRDFMIGSPEINIDGITRDGTIVPVLSDGRFVL